MYHDSNKLGYNSDGSIYINVGLCQLIVDEDEFLDFCNYLDTIYNDKSKIKGGFNNIIIEWGNIHSEINHNFVELYNNINLFKENDLKIIST